MCILFGCLRGITAIGGIARDWVANRDAVGHYTVLPFLAFSVLPRKTLKLPRNFSPYGTLVVKSPTPLFFPEIPLKFSLSSP